MATRAVFVDAALDLIREEGLAAFTQPRVANRTGLRQSHLTYYFPTRDDLLVAVAEQAVQDRITALGSVESARSPRSKVKALARVLTDPEQTRILLALIQSADRAPDVAAAFQRLRLGTAPGSDSLLRGWGAESTPRTHQLLQAACTGIAVLALANGGSDFEKPAEALLNRLLTGLRATEPKERT